MIGASHRLAITATPMCCIKRLTMRDRRFVAMHRGGPLDRDSHCFLARWAADCAGRVVHLFSRCSEDIRPERALETARAWADGEVGTGAAMKASVAAHAAARKVTDKAAIAAARAAGQAAATAHFADHSMGALLYVLKALEASGCASDSELEFQLAKLPEHLREPVSSGVEVRLQKLGIRAIASQGPRARALRRAAGWTSLPG